MKKINLPNRLTLLRVAPVVGVKFALLTRSAVVGSGDY